MVKKPTTKIKGMDERKKASEGKRIEMKTK